VPLHRRHQDKRGVHKEQQHAGGSDLRDKQTMRRMERQRDVVDEDAAHRQRSEHVEITFGNLSAVDWHNQSYHRRRTVRQ
jgi:hypothetical protein